MSVGVFVARFRKSILLFMFLVMGLSSAVGDEIASPETLFAIKEMTPGYTGKFIWGLFTRKCALRDLPQLQSLWEEYPADQKVEVVRYITPGGLGEAEGIKPNDVVFAVSEYSSVTSKPGDKLQMKIWRQSENSLCDITVTLPQYYKIAFEPYVKPAGAAEFEKDLPPDWSNYYNFLLQEPIKNNFDDLRQRLTDIDSLPDAYRLLVFRYLIRNPFRLEQVSRNWTEKLASKRDFPELLGVAQYMLEFAPRAESSRIDEICKTLPAITSESTLDEIVEFYLQLLKQCDELHKKAFGRISAEEMAFVRQYRHDAFNSICNYHMLSYEPDVESARRTLKIFEILNRIEWNALFDQATLSTLVLYNNEALARLKTLLTGRQGEILRKKTPYGDIVICGFGNDHHTEDAALLIDLGGDDIYLNNQATPVAGKCSTAIILDCFGNDYYSSTDSAGQGCGDLGVGLLMDLSGNDTYCGIEMAQGSAFGGVGILYDQSGNDDYRSTRMSQATAFFGTGMLIDQTGNDRYTVQHFGQALGSVRGMGLLMDGTGNDHYICMGSQQTSYDTRGNYDGWGQGIGFGVRPFASGGIGILLDKNGRDRYEGGTFTQGGGYYYGYGICCDRGQESDFYLGTRYAQGFAAHQALGAFIEHGGNDVYRMLHCVSLCISWDETVVLFVDDNGDDDYHTGLGAWGYSAVHNNGIGFFFDRGGNDSYGKSEPLPRSNNNYHGGSSLGIFIDSNSGNDQYIQRQNNSSFTEAGDHIFVDK